MVQCCNGSIWSLCSLLRTVTSIHHTTWNAIFQWRQRPSNGSLARSDGTLTAFLVRRRNLRSRAEACLQNSSCFCSQRHWLTPMFFPFSQFIILQIILHGIYYSFLLVVSCLEYGRRVKRSPSYSRVYFPVIFDSFTSHCNLLFRSTFSLIHIINQSLIYLPSWCYNNSSCTPSIDLLFPSI